MADTKIPSEPWFYEHNNASIRQGYAIGLYGEKTELGRTWIADFGHIENENAVATVERVITCVNALAGIASPVEFVENAKNNDIKAFIQWLPTSGFKLRSDGNFEHPPVRAI